VGPMSLYRHVRDKDDLLNEVVDRLLATAWRPTTRSKDWRVWVVDAADKLRKFLVNEPAALHVFLRQPVVSPSAAERMEAVLAVLREAGFSDAAAKRAYAAIHTYTLGFSALQASRQRWEPPPEGAAGMTKQLAAYTSPRQFGEGLKYLLAGIESEL